MSPLFPSTQLGIYTYTQVLPIYIWHLAGSVDFSVQLALGVGGIYGIIII